MMKRLFFLMLILPFGIAIAQEPLTPENLWKLKRIYGEQVSPSGDMIIYTLKTYDLDQNNGTAHLYLMNTDGGNNKMISDGETSIIDAQWRPDGKKIGYLSSESGSMQLWEINPDGSEKRKITELPNGISNWHYSPDIKHISFTQEVQMEQSLAEKHRDLPKATGRAYDDLMYRHWAEWHNYKYSHVFYAPYDDGQIGADYIDIMPADPYDSPLQPFGGGESIVWAPDGKSIIYVCKKKKGKEWAESTNSDLYQYDLESGSTRNLTDFNQGYDTEPVFSPDGSKLAWMSMKRDGFESDKNIVRVMDMTTGKHTAITEDIDQTFGHLVWAKTSNTLYVTSPVNATYQVFEIKFDDQLNRTGFNTVTEGIHNINSIQLSGSRLIGTKTTMSRPAELFSWDRKTGKEAQLSNANGTLLANMPMGKVEKRMIKTTDGKEMHTWVIYPVGFNPDLKYPTLLYCQGGPQSAVSQFFSYRWNFQLMASKGYIVVAPNRRGLPSFGQDWNDEISQDWGGQAMKDYLSAIDEISKEPYVDKDRLGAVGASYGGYSVYYLAGIHNGRFKAFISHCGLFNLESWYASTEELFFANWDIGGPYWNSPTPKSYKKFSPHLKVDKWDTPIMVIHNQLDFRVPLTQGLEAFNAAQIRGVPSKLLYYPDEGHWVLKPQNGVLWHREFYDWLDQWLKD